MRGAIRIASNRSGPACHAPGHLDTSCHLGTLCTPFSQSTLTYRDANGDGVIEPNEVSLSNPADQGNSMPTRGAGLQNTITLLGGRFRIGALIDYKGGNRLIDPVLRRPLLFGTSRASADSHTSLAEQAQAIAVKMEQSRRALCRSPAGRVIRAIPRVVVHGKRESEHRSCPADDLRRDLICRAQSLVVDSV